MKKDKLKIGQLVVIIQKPLHPSAVEIGDIASECGYTNMDPFEGQHQFHSQDLIDNDKYRENYWIEFLPRNCYQLLRINI